MIRLSDYVFQRLREWGVKHCFLVTGGGAMFLNDSLATTEGITAICNHHEQACAMAAEVYARVTGKTGVINVTAGPGGINALNGVFGAWTDSIPMLVLSGQVKRQTLMAAQGIRDLRQLGDQEADIVAMAKGITKYAQLITDPSSIRYHLEKAWHLAATGRPGPVWLDIPVDVQSAMIDPAKLWGFTPPSAVNTNLVELVRQALDRIRASKRPVILAGTGVRLGHATEVFQRVIEKLGIPVTTAWTHDLLASDHPLHCGRPGTIGNRPGNFTVQNADTLLILGSRLNIRQVSYNWPAFARAAYKIWVDVDAAELRKPTVKPDLPVHADVREFLDEMERQIDASPKLPDYSEWISWCKKRVEKYPALYGKEASSNGRLNPYVFVDELFRRLAADDVVVCGNATACIVPYQTAKLQAGQRLISNSGSASMGHDLPAAIGAAVARASCENKRVICLAGDGSIQLNIQELQTIAHHRMAIKIFVLNNDGYLSIRTTQENFFKKMLGEGPRSGVSFPNILRIAAAYDIPSVRIDPENCDFETARALASEGPMVCEVMLDPLQKFEPRLAARKLADGRLTSPPLEDMFPFLEREEFSENLLIPAWSGE